MDDIRDIRRVRTQLGITQHELAKKTGISQSLIAKIESDRLDPSYSKAKKILETLDSLQNNEEPAAREIMRKKVILVKYSDSLRSMIEKMRQKDISQMPVIKNNKVIGYLSEQSILKNLLDKNKSNKIVDLMEPTPPILPPSTKQSVLANLLKHFPLILIEEEGTIVGIVTKYDLIKSIYR